MVSASPDRILDELTLGKGFSLEDLVDRAALGEMAESVRELFGLSIRIFSQSGVLLSDASSEPSLYLYLDGFRPGKKALAAVVAEVKTLDPGDSGEAFVTCVSGARYLVSLIRYDGRSLGRLILGPYRPPEQSEPRGELSALDADIDPAKLSAGFRELPAKSDEDGRRIARHLGRALDLILFSGHRALLTSSMHLASVQESFRELQEKNTKLQHAYDRLKELDRLKSNFLATVSHELRTPLTSIIGYSEMLAEGIAGPISGEQKEFVSTIHEKGEQLLELIKGLLDLSKLESGTMSLRKAEMEVGPLIEDVTQTLAPAARKKKIDLRAEIESGLPGLWADSERLRQVLLNLTENAIKFTPAGGRVVLSAGLTMLERKADEEGRGLVLLGGKRSAIEIAVADTGRGIPDAEKERVFDAFYQVDGSSTREHGGTGLGLSIVRRLVDAHDGVVRIEDNQPNGAVFVVTIPCRRTTIA
jgi:two-component system, NarL family, sensor histidine kinase BarA